MHAALNVALSSETPGSHQRRRHARSIQGARHPPRPRGRGQEFKPRWRRRRKALVLSPERKL